MANENDESWGTSPRIVDETVRVTKKFLESHPEIKMTLSTVAQRLRQPNYPIGAEVISKFLGGNWNESRVQWSLERLGLIGKVIDETVRSVKKFLENHPEIKVPTVVGNI